MVRVHVFMSTARAPYERARRRARASFCAHVPLPFWPRLRAPLPRRLPRSCLHLYLGCRFCRLPTPARALRAARCCCRSTAAPARALPVCRFLPPRTMRFAWFLRSRSAPAARARALSSPPRRVLPDGSTTRVAHHATRIRCRVAPRSVLPRFLRRAAAAARRLPAAVPRSGARRVRRRAPGATTTCALFCLPCRSVAVRVAAPRARSGPACCPAFVAGSAARCRPTTRRRRAPPATCPCRSPRLPRAPTTFPGFAGAALPRTTTLYYTTGCPLPTVCRVHALALRVARFAARLLFAAAGVAHDIVFTHFTRHGDEHTHTA